MKRGAATALTSLLLASAAARADDWIPWPGEATNAQSYMEMNPSSARKVMRDGYSSHRVISIATRIHARGKPYNNRQTQTYVDCPAPEFMTVYQGQHDPWNPIPLESPEYALWDYLCNKS